MTFKELNAVNANELTEKKGRFTYLSWAHAWAELKKLYPDSTFEKHEFDHCGIMLPYMKDAQGQTYVKVSVTVEGVTLSETMPVLNHSNKSISDPNSFDVNTQLQRCLAKAIAMHGLGLYIYAGEDLPDSNRDASNEANEPVADHTEEQKKAFDEIIKIGAELDMYVFSRTIPRPAFTSLYNSFPRGEVTKGKQAVDAMGKNGREMYDQYLSLWQEAIHNGDDSAIEQLRDEISISAANYIKDQA